jgi:hypothetical protein
MGREVVNDLIGSTTRSGGKSMPRNESLREELLSEVDSIAPILADHAASSEKLGRLDAVH